MTVDVCSRCRGVWLDRGELEKLLAYAKREIDEERSHYGEHEREPPSSDRRPERVQHDPRQGHHKKRSWLDNLGDIFD